MYNIAIKKYLEDHGFEAFCPKAVLFDMDGVLYDSMCEEVQSVKVLLIVGEEQFLLGLLNADYRLEDGASPAES